MNAETETETPLLRFLRTLTKDERIGFATACGTRETYLYQLAGAPSPNPTLKLALALVDESSRIARRKGTQALSLPELLVGNPHGRPQTHKLREAAGERDAAPAAGRVRGDPRSGDRDGPV